MPTTQTSAKRRQHRPAEGATEAGTITPDREAWPPLSGKIADIQFGGTRRFFAAIKAQGGVPPCWSWNGPIQFRVYSQRIIGREGAQYSYAELGGDEPGDFIDLTADQVRAALTAAQRIRVRWFTRKEERSPITGEQTMSGGRVSAELVPEGAAGKLEKLAVSLVLCPATDLIPGERDADGLPSLAEQFPDEMG